MTTEHKGRIEVVWAYGKYNNRRLDNRMETEGVGYRIEVIGRPAGRVGYVKLPGRWVVEHTFAWLGRYRRDSRHYEVHERNGESMLKVSSIHRMLGRLKPDTSNSTAPFKYRSQNDSVSG